MTNWEMTIPTWMLVSTIVVVVATIIVKCVIGHKLRVLKREDEEKQKEVREAREEDERLRRLFPGPWYDFYQQVRALRYFKLRVARIQSFCVDQLTRESVPNNLYSKHAEVTSFCAKSKIPGLSAEAIHALTALVDGGPDSSKNIAQVSEHLCCFIESIWSHESARKGTARLPKTAQERLSEAVQRARSNYHARR